jgi:cation:H+ antiporter
MLSLERRRDELEPGMAERGPLSTSGLLLSFLASGAGVCVLGVALARCADVIAERTRIGGVWIGTVLLAGATSLPELGTSVSAVGLDAANLAVGNLFGSSMANMLILALVDLLLRRERLLSRVAFDHALAASVAIGLNALAAMFIVVGSERAIWRVSPASLLLFGAYLAGTRVLYRNALGGGAPAAAREAGAPAMSLARAGQLFALAALGLLAVTPAFAWSAHGVATVTGLGDTFVGTWAVGLSTSLPELVASLAAVRRGAFDLAVGNLFGSNAVNMALFLPLDLVEAGSVFQGLDLAHAASALLAVVLMALSLAAILYRAKRRFGMVEPDSALVLLAYLVGLWLLYQHGAAR